MRTQSVSGDWAGEDNVTNFVVKSLISPDMLINFSNCFLYSDINWTLYSYLVNSYLDHATSYIAILLSWQSHAAHFQVDSFDSQLLSGLNGHST